MKYELATELKDAGFPQGGSGAWVGDPNAVVLRGGDRVYAPTLSELIAACGSRFGMLRAEIVHGAEDAPRKWIAREIGNEQIRATVGDNPEEAVARLWLALDRKVGGLDA